MFAMIVEKGAAQFALLDEKLGADKTILIEFSIELSLATYSSQLTARSA
jgi:hypothetical protein